jgi:hypothetical protein
VESSVRRGVLACSPAPCRYPEHRDADRPDPQSANGMPIPAPNWLPGGIGGGWAVSKAVAAFVTTLPRMSGAPRWSAPAYPVELQAR